MHIDISAPPAIHPWTCLAQSPQSCYQPRQLPVHCSGQSSNTQIHASAACSVFLWHQQVIQAGLPQLTTGNVYTANKLMMRRYNTGDATSISFYNTLNPKTVYKDQPIPMAITRHVSCNSMTVPQGVCLNTGACLVDYGILHLINCHAFKLTG